MISYIKRHLNRNFLILFAYDIFILNTSLFLSAFIRYETISFSLISDVFSLRLLIFTNLIKIACFKFSYLYRGMWRYTSIWDVINIIKANFISSSLIVFYIYFTSGFVSISRSLFVIDFLICTAFIGAFRVGIRIFLGNIFSLVSNENVYGNLKRIVLVGAGFAGQRR